jgi:sugar lactone lactonase YvrE
MRKIHTLLDGLVFPEAPRWHDGTFYFSDMHAHRVLRVGADGATEGVLEHTAAVSGLGWLADGAMLVVDMDGFVLRVDAGGVSQHADLRDVAKFGVNDMVTHPGGWSYVGQFGFDRHSHGEAPLSPIVRVDADGSVGIASPDGLHVANGMAITPDGETLLVAETAGGRISSFRIGDRGELGPRRTWADLPGGRLPDGMCLDAEGSIWAACIIGGSFDRFVEGGDIVDSIPVEEDGRHPIACMLGGPERHTLYLLTATTYGREDEALATVDARIDTVEVDVPGAGWP